MYITLIQRNTYCNPVNIFYEDPSAFPKEYQRRIKIQHNYKYVSDMSNCIEMSVENNPKILTNNTHEISNEDFLTNHSPIRIFSHDFSQMKCDTSVFL